MLNYTGNQWLLVDLAAMYGLDKKLFEERLAWGRQVLPVIQICDSPKDLGEHLKHWIDLADEPEMFSACALAIWDSLNGNPSGYMVGLDAASSGPQLLSLLTRCIIGMGNTGAIGDTVPDLYTTILGNVKGFETSRKRVKKATVPHVYGSESAPMEVFGKHYTGFLKACSRTMPRAEAIRGILISEAWNSEALFHEWELPDGAVAHCRVIEALNTVGKFGKVSYTFRHDINKPKKRGTRGTKSLAANVTHSYDAYVLRELHRRCNYNSKQVHNAISAIEYHLKNGSRACNLKLRHLSHLAEKFNTVSVVAIEHIRKHELSDVSPVYLKSLLVKLQGLLEYTPFPLRTIHDEFAACPNYLNRMKWIFNTILVEAYESSWLFDTLTTLTGNDYSQDIDPIDPEISKLIQNNLYAIN